MKTACIACNAPCKLDMHALVKLSIYRFKVLTTFYAVKTTFNPVLPIGLGKTGFTRVFDNPVNLWLI